MKKAFWQNWACSMAIVMLSVSQVLAQQSSQGRGVLHNTKPIYVAQNTEAGGQTTTDVDQGTSGTTAKQEPTSTSAAGEQQKQGTASSTSSGAACPCGQQAVDDSLAVDNGLWEGCTGDSCCATCGGGYCTPPSWYLEQGAKMLTRSRPRVVTITYEPYFTFSTSYSITGFNAAKLMDDRSASYDVAPGYTATIGHYLGRDAQDRDDFLEFTYWGMNTWTDSANVQAGQQTIYFGSYALKSGKLSTPFLISQYATVDSALQVGDNVFGVGGFDFTDKQEIKLSSEIHNFELNFRMRPRGRPDQLVLHPDGRWRRECQPGTYMSYLCGLRVMTIGDGFDLHCEGNPSWDDVVMPVTADYKINTENTLLGMQIGADMIFRRCKWSWGVQSKVGPYVNFCKNEKTVTTSASAWNTYIESLGSYAVSFDTGKLVARKQQIALIGEVGFTAEYKFKPNLTGHVSYDFIWAEGLALAPEQLDWSYSQQAKINTNGSMFSHGLTLSLDWTW